MKALPLLGLTLLLVPSAFAQEQLDLEGIQIQGEVETADLAILGARTAWVIPIKIAPPTSFRDHFRLAVRPVVLPAIPLPTVGPNSAANAQPKPTEEKGHDR